MVRVQSIDSLILTFYGKIFFFPFTRKTATGMIIFHTEVALSAFLPKKYVHMYVYNMYFYMILIVVILCSKLIYITMIYRYFLYR